MTRTIAPASLVARYLSYPEAASYSGLSTSTIRKLVGENKLAAYKPTGSRKVLLDRHQIDRLIEGSREAGR
jgi:excisionase family DNA binding protein